jgi:aminobenzoyl-glutamate utilization protein A
METRGATNEINDYMTQKAREVLEGAAKMYGLDLEIRPVESTVSATNSPDLIELGTRVAKSLASVNEIVPACAANGSEDVCLMMQRVQERGGKAMEVLLGTPIGGGHHSATFDVDERVIRNGAEFFAAMYDAVAATGCR